MSVTIVELSTFPVSSLGEPPIWRPSQWVATIQYFGIKLAPHVLGHEIPNDDINTLTTTLPKSSWSSPPVVEYETRERIIRQVANALAAGYESGVLTRYLWKKL